jgi:hypothetical protein
MPSPLRQLPVLVLAVALAAAGCGASKHTTGPSASTPRTWHMGFSAIPPRADGTALLQTLEAWTPRADAAILHIEPPWAALLAGAPPDSLVRGDALALVQYYRAHGLHVWITLDATNGLDRSAESEALVQSGRSLTEPAVQRLYRDYAVALDTLLHPEHFGLAAETNLIRLAAPPALYAAVRQAANGAASDVRAVDATVDLYVSVQVEVAWGRLGGTPAPYAGVDTDFADFPFLQSLGLSSYPYFAWTDPDSLPDDYYSRLASGRGVPVAVVEGGWTSASVGAIQSDRGKQERYIERQARLLETAHAIGLFQLTFTDLDLTANPPPPGSILPLFAALGLVDVRLIAKPALVAWDRQFARDWEPPL